MGRRLHHDFKVKALFKAFTALLLLAFHLTCQRAFSQEGIVFSPDTLKLQFLEVAFSSGENSFEEEGHLLEEEEDLEETRRESFWSTLGRQFKISSESEPSLKSSFGIDFLTMFYGLTHRGFGFGLSYEKQIIPHFAQKGLFSAIFMDTKYEGIYALPLTVGYFAYFYPMSRRLQKFYSGLGIYVDYVSYSKSYSLTYGGVNFSAAAQAGYKILLPFNFMADFSLSYKMPVLDTIDAYGDLDGYINKKIQFGIGLKYTKFPELIRNVRNVRASVRNPPDP